MLFCPKCGSLLVLKKSGSKKTMACSCGYSTTEMADAKIKEEIEKKENNIGKFLYDEQLFSDLKASFEQVNELTKIITEQLKSGGLEVKADVDLF